MTQSKIVTEFQSRGCQVTPKAWDGVIDGQVVTTYGAVVSITAGGSTESRTIRESDVIDPDAIVEEMRAAVAKRNTRTRAAIRSERARS